MLQLLQQDGAVIGQFPLRDLLQQSAESTADRRALQSGGQGITAIDGQILDS